MVASLTRRLEVNQLAELNSTHYRELVQKRGLNPDWVAVNCKSVDAKTATEHLGYTAYSDGILLSGHGYQEQFKPDKPWKSQDGKKAPKYRSCKDEDGYDAMLPAHPDNPTFWDNLEALKEQCYQIDGHPCLVATEGFLKAIALTSHGIPTVGILGVEQGLTASSRDSQGKRYLVDALESFSRAGVGFIIGFDADCATNDKVIKAQIKLAHQLSLFGVPVYSITGLWHEAEGKGIDDYIQMNGFEKFRDEVLARAETLEQWKEKHLKNLERQVNQDSKTKPPTPRETSKELAEDYGENWRYHNEQKTWRYWNGKCWESVDDGVFRSTVKTDIDGRGVNYSRPAYISDVVSLMNDDLRVPKWETLERYKYIPFDNGVVETATGKLRKHDPDDGFTHVLPHTYKFLKVDDPLEALKNSCPNTHRYMMIAQQDNKLMIKKMLAAVNGVITGKFSQLQLFLQLIGKTRAGKGTFTRLLKECIGANNHASASLKDLARPEIRASIIDKVLVEFPEQRSTNDEAIGWLLALTGGDAISCKRLYKDPTSEKFNGCPVITSNRQIGTAKFPELDERLCLITFNHTIPRNKRIHNLDQLIKAEIPQLVAIALNMSEAEVTQLLKGVGEGDNPAVKLHQWELKTEESVVTAFFNDALIVEPGNFVTTSKLHEKFKSYCLDQGKQPLSLKRFARELNELCEHLDLGVNWNKDVRHSQFEGVRLREDWDTLPTYEQTLRQSLAPIERVQAPIDSVTSAPIETQTQREIAPIAPIESNLFSSDSHNSQKTNLPDWKPGQLVRMTNSASEFKGQVGEFLRFEFCNKWKKEVAVVQGFKEGVESRYPHSHFEAVDNLEPVKPVEKPQPKKQFTPKPALANLTPSDKERWLENNHNARKEVWVELDDYQGEATLKGLRDGKWLIEPPHKWSPIPVEADCISVLESQLGKFKPTPKPPIGDQVELPLEQPQEETPQTETPHQRVKRLAKQMGMGVKSKDFDDYLEKFQKSKFSELTNSEAIELGDVLQRQIENFEKTKRDLGLH